MPVQMTGYSPLRSSRFFEGFTSKESDLFERKTKLFPLKLMAMVASSAMLGAAAVISGFRKTETDEGPVQGAPWLFGSTQFKLKDVGYRQSEYFIKGMARRYASEKPLTSDGKWQVDEAETAPFRTRIVVYQPIDPARFNGTVIIEWFNVSGGTEASSEWIMAHTELTRKGYAWVGVSAQKAGIDGGGLTVLPISLALKKVNPFRYGSLKHPGDAFAFDIFHQAAKAVLQPGHFSPLGDLKVERAIASGESQSADFLMTYINAIAPRETVFDGFFVHSRLHGSASLSPGPGTLILDFLNRIPVQVRDDLGVPVLMLQTENDMTVLGAYTDRQADTDHFRLWEVAGTAHADHYVGNVGLKDHGDDPRVAAVVETRYAIPLLVRCRRPVNAGPQHFVVKAAIHALDNWLRSGTPPPSADRFEFDDATGTLQRNQLGIVKGGIRTPYVDVPIAALSGEGQPGDDLFCALYGTTRLFSRRLLRSLYSDHQTYVKAVSDSVDAAVSLGYLLAPDGDLIKRSAQASDIGFR